MYVVLVHFPVGTAEIYPEFLAPIRFQQPLRAYQFLPGHPYNNILVTVLTQGSIYV